MTELEQLKAIVQGAQNGANTVEIYAEGNVANSLIMSSEHSRCLIWANEKWVSANTRTLAQCWPIRALSDITRQIELLEEVERLKLGDWTPEEYHSICASKHIRERDLEMQAKGVGLAITHYVTNYSKSSLSVDEFLACFEEQLAQGEL